MEGLNPGLDRADPRVYKIIGGRVFLFSNVEALARWNENEEVYRARADRNFESIVAGRQVKQRR